MINFLRRIFRREPSEPTRPDTEEVAKIRAILAARAADILSCCGRTRYSHGQFRSGALKCPPSRKELDAEFKSGLYKYNPLESTFEPFPADSEPHWSCDSCGCKRGVHRREGWRRKECLDPDCPVCPKGCSPP